MRKEVLIAITFGILTGIIVAYGVWRANSALKTKTENTVQSLNGTTDDSQKQEFKITLAKPEENEVIISTPTFVSGITKASSFLAISGEEEDFIVFSPTGSFEQEIGLIGGVNQILAVAFDSENKQTEVLRTIVFSTEFEKEITTRENEESIATDSADSIREAVRDKLEEARINPKAFLGTITDKSQNALQIKDNSGEIQLISVAENAIFVKLNKTSTTVSFDDVAIGDFIVPMGFLGSNNGVLEAKRILVTQPITSPGRKVVLGTVGEIVKKEITVTDSRGENLTFVFPRRWKGPEITEIEEGEKVIIVALEDEGKLLIRTIEKVNELPSATPE